ncbi:hypothetical protein C8R43DRAFT_943535 [Mycena crocata]|nr:hypothetical protein C8R43DRAFT_943535 [Mycena crocata]
MFNGGHIYGENYRHFPRFPMVKISWNHSDAKMTAFAATHCAEYYKPLSKSTASTDRPHVGRREEVNKLKYLLDVDGNTFSGRFLGLLPSGHKNVTSFFNIASEHPAVAKLTTEYPILMKAADLNGLQDDDRRGLVGWHVRRRVNRGVRKQLDQQLARFKRKHMIYDAELRTPTFVRSFASRFNPRASIPLKVKRMSNTEDDVERPVKRARTGRPA